MPFDSTGVLFHEFRSGITFVLEQYSGEGCSTERPKTLTGVWGVLFWTVLVGLGRALGIAGLTQGMSQVSHRGTCRSAFRFAAVSRAAVAVGADGLIIEVHPCPERALSDGPQSLDFAAFEKVMRGLSEPLRGVASA